MKRIKNKAISVNLILFMLFIITNSLISQVINNEIPNKKIAVAVLDLKPISIPNETAVILSETLRSELFRHNKFVVMNREDMTSIMEEQALQNSGACDTKECMVELGIILGVDKIITGTIGKLGDTYSITIKQIDIETSKNDQIISDRKKASEDYLFTMVENIAMELSGITTSNKNIIQNSDSPKEMKLDKEKDGGNMWLWITVGSVAVLGGGAAIYLLSDEQEESSNSESYDLHFEIHIP